MKLERFLYSKDYYYRKRFLRDDSIRPYLSDYKSRRSAHDRRTKAGRSSLFTSPSPATDGDSGANLFDLVFVPLAGTGGRSFVTFDTRSTLASNFLARGPVMYIHTISAELL